MAFKITPAITAGVVTHDEATHYLANAKIALSAIYHQPKPIAEGNSDGQKDTRKKRKNN